MTISRRKFLLWSAALTAGASMPAVPLEVSEEDVAVDLDPQVQLSPDFSYARVQQSFVVSMTAITDAPTVVYLMCDEEPLVSLYCPLKNLVTHQDLLGMASIPKAQGKLWIKCDANAVARVDLYEGDAPKTITDVVFGRRTSRILVGGTHVQP